MFPVSDGFQRAVLSAYKHSTIVQYSIPGVVTEWQTINCISGQINCDRTSQCRWSGNIVVKGATIDSRHLSSYGARVRILRGIVLPRVGVEYVPWGVYRVDEIEAPVGSDTATLTLVGYEKQIQDARFPIPRSFSQTNARKLVTDLVQEAVPNTIVYWDDRLGNPLIAPFQVALDRWETIDGTQDGSSIAQSIGAETFFDGRATFRASPVPTIFDTPVLAMSSSEQSVILARSDKMTRDGVYNVVVVKDSSTDAKVPFSPAWAWDNDPYSPTYAGPDPIQRPRLAGPFGVKPRFYTSPFFTNRAQMQAMATAQLRGNLGLKTGMSFEQFANPALEAGDVVLVDGIPYLIDSWSADLIGHSMSCQTRASRDDVGDVEIQPLFLEDAR